MEGCGVDAGGRCWRCGSPMLSSGGCSCAMKPATGLPCHTCGGTGVASEPMYSLSGGGTFLGSTFVMCRQCNGTGLVWTNRT